MLGIMISVAILTFAVMAVDEDEVSFGKSIMFAIGSSLVLGLALSGLLELLGLIGLILWIILAPIAITIGIWLVFNLDLKRAAIVSAIYVGGNIIYTLFIIFAF